MIQRVQTIYLLLASISLFVIIFLPIGYQEAASNSVTNVDVMDNLPTFILSIISAIVGLVSIFLFRNRKLQMLITSLFILLSILTLASLVFFDFVTGKSFITKPNFIPYGLAIFGAIFGLLAHRGISADEKLVRSMDRLR